MKIYYAHPVSLYGTKQEARDIATLRALGFEVLNPNSPEHVEHYAREGMCYFLDLALSCDAIAFRAFPTGEIGAGIAAEVDAVSAYGKPVIELPGNILARTATVDRTMELLREAGAR
jgi:hypothetical protein